MIPATILVATFLLAWSNGANDNFKGVATLWGSGVLGYRAAQAWAAVATLAGGLTSVLLAGQLVKTFSGEAVLQGGAASDTMLAAMLAAAGVTIFLATVVSMPTSTTHALMGALVGVALAVDPARLRVDRLGSLFFGPMLLSPLIAGVAAMLLFTLARSARRRIRAHRASCVCVDVAQRAVLPAADGTLAFSGAPGPSSLRWRVDDAAACEATAEPSLLRVDTKRLANAAHVVSGGAVCFARALNDTPKIAAVLLASHALLGPGRAGVLALVTVVVVVGGIVQSRGVARTMSHGITRMDPGSGLAANVVTAGLVLWASRLGLPVSTTHVSCASIFGIGAAKRRAHLGTISRVLATWVTTFPLAALIGAGAYAGLRALGQGA